MTRQVSLSVNGVTITLDSFVEEFTERTVRGMVAALKGAGEVETADIIISGDKVTININGDSVPTNLFASKIIKSTIEGLVAPLKGVSEISSLTINISR
ncbi:hypothetical protein ACFLVB_01635 [Chloroflexota bacterium]